MRRNHSHVRRWMIALVSLVISSFFFISPSQAATEILYYKETGHYVRGVFRDFWDKNGGLANFGYPITEEYYDPQTGKVYQYFERARFERDKNESTAVSLGMLGRELLGSRTFARQEKITNTAQRRYFDETGQILQYGFKEIWEGRGGQAVFGLPLSSEVEEQLSNGKVHTVQWFERARFEYWPDMPAGQRVLVSALGRQQAPASLIAPLAPDSPPAGPLTLGSTPPPATPAPTQPPTTPGQPPATPAPTQPAPTPVPPPPTPAPSGSPLQRPLLPESKSSVVVPEAGLPGQTFIFQANGFNSQEKVSVWLNTPDGSVVGANFQLQASRDGVSPAVTFTTYDDYPLGVWSFVAYGHDSKHEAVGYFLLIGSNIGRLPEPGPGVPANVNASVEPSAGPAGTIFFFDAFNFQPGEDVKIVITRSDGFKTEANFVVRADTRGSIRHAGVFYATELDYPLGLYNFSATGQTSQRTSTAYFVLTP
jgi:hypothetical protein